MNNDLFIICANVFMMK